MGYLAASTILDLSGYVRALANRTCLLRAWSVFMEDYPLVRFCEDLCLDAAQTIETAGGVLAHQ
jgi:hypothetical protein